MVHPWLDLPSFLWLFPSSLASVPWDHFSSDLHTSPGLKLCCDGNPGWEAGLLRLLAQQCPLLLVQWSSGSLMNGGGMCAIISGMLLILWYSLFLRTLKFRCFFLPSFHYQASKGYLLLPNYPPSPKVLKAHILSLLLSCYYCSPFLFHKALSLLLYYIVSILRFTHIFTILFSHYSFSHIRYFLWNNFSSF